MTISAPELVKAAEQGEALCQILLAYIDIDPASPLQVLLGTSREEANQALFDLRILLANLKS